MRPRVIIIGAGFAGLNAAKALKNAPVDVLMLDKNNYHTFQPLLYQVATAGLEVGDIAMQVRHIFRKQANFRFRQATVTDVNWDTKEVIVRGGESLSFDYLIIAAGAIYNNFGVKGVYEHGFMLKSLTEAANLRSHMLKQFELASSHPELIETGLLNFVIVGAGPTGVEMAGALAELLDRVLPKDYPELDLNRAKIILLEMTDKVLLPYSKETQAYTQKVLENLNVDIRFKTTVAEVMPDAVKLKDGSSIPTQTLIWAAGVRAHPLVENLGLELDRGFRAKVNPDLSLPDKPYAFMVGDMAAAKDKLGELLPQVATVAIQQGKHVGKQIRRLQEGQRTKVFEYFDKGSMAIIGRNAGVAELSKNLGGFHLRGFLGWLGWLFIHLIYLPGHQNKANALLEWAYNYFTYDRHVRLITYMKTSEGETDLAKEHERQGVSA
ncbi:MAG: NAD(P)/FAD-dependent oxidoreductase [Trueperaceae bacterium]|nr:NAD(P)/FAD-dependent oxidoreductase [Trueperaceae bacterium]